MFNSCLKNGFVPDSFALSIIVPESKDNGNQYSKFEGYRPVSLVTIFSKVFELNLLEQLQHIGLSDELQIVFTAGQICQEALKLVNCVTEHFNNGGSVFYAAALDISKAFDGFNYVCKIYGDWYTYEHAEHFC